MSLSATAAVAVAGGLEFFGVSHVVAIVVGVALSAFGVLAWSDEWSSKPRHLDAE